MKMVGAKNPEYGSDLIVDLMKRYDIKYAALNPGSSFRALHDSIVNYGGNENPKIVLACHEEIAVAIAHGYARASGQPGLAICHDVVGLQHASMLFFSFDIVSSFGFRASNLFDYVGGRPLGPSW
jgi:acetolactate synthase-1/2/3 large subunit